MVSLRYLIEKLDSVDDDVLHFTPTNQRKVKYYNNQANNEQLWDESIILTNVSIAE